jgi:plasmid stability protein
MNGGIMPTTITLKNVPEDIYARLKASAELHRRSINSEAIVCLEAMLAPGRFDAGERLRRARLLRSQLGTIFQADELDTLKREGRS